MPVLRTSDKRISYWIGERDLSGKRETILFVHGAGGGQFVWSFQKAFFEKEFRPILIDLPGHGESGGEGEEKIERYADHVYDFLRTLGTKAAFLVGHSMGGAIAQTLTLDHPEVVRGVVLVGTGAKLRVLPWIFEGIRNDFKETIGKITRFAFSRKAPPEWIEQGVQSLMQCRPEVLYGDFLACDRFDLMNEVSKIDLPTLVICGEDDELTPVKYSQFLQSRIKGSRLEIIPRAGHMVMMESPEVFNRGVREFIIDLSKGFKGESE